MFIGSNDLVAKKSVKSLGFWWSWDLSAKVAIDEAAKKSKESFLYAQFPGVPRPT